MLGIKTRGGGGELVSTTFALRVLLRPNTILSGEPMYTSLHGVLSAVPTKPPIAPEIKSLRSWAVLLCTSQNPQVKSGKRTTVSRHKSGRYLETP